MSYVEVVALGLVQGLTEFIPVSSSGHLVAARLMFGISDVEGNAFDAFLHLGTLAAVIVYYWEVWRGLVRSLVTNDTEGKDKRELAAKLALATVPAATVGYLFAGNVEAHFRGPVPVAMGLVMTAVALAMVEVQAHRKTTLRRAAFFDALIIGLVQVAALFPGVSRSGVTIATGRARGLSRKQATTFSFLLSAPLIAGAGLSSLTSLTANGYYAYGELLLGFMASFVSGWLAITILLKIVERVAFWPFVFYLFGLAAVLVYYA